MDHRQFMLRAIKISVENVTLRSGGPFGAVIVLNNKIIGEGFNSVTTNNDPTAHAEVQAIRNACKTIGDFDLSNAVIYTSCEPCPMCLSAIYWARIKKIYFGNTKADAAKINFDDQFIYEQIPLDPAQRKIPSEQMLADQAIEAFSEWQKKENKISY
jgi:tRNA(Arg) A34 adenosine deaminase TadA